MVYSDRYACMSDLNNYFKKADLLKGLSEAEKVQLRSNIGIMNYNGEGGQSTPVEITYSALYDLILHSNLVVGARYVITDFQTIYTSNLVSRDSWGTTSSINPSTIYQMVVIANTNTQLDRRAFILSHPKWVVEYDVTREILPDDVLTKGKIVYLKDENGNSAYYDFKNIKFRRTQAQLAQSNLYISSPYIDLYTFSDVQNEAAIENSSIATTKYNVLDKDCWNNVFIGDTYNNFIGSASKNNTFLRGCNDCNILWGTVNNMFNESVSYLTGSIYNKTTPIGNTTLSTSITKTVHKVNETTIVSFLDPITYAYQVITL